MPGANNNRLRSASFIAMTVLSLVAR
jgi:hypothetical protein